MSSEVFIGQLWVTGFLAGIFVGYVISGYRVKNTKNGKSKDFR